jgi:hypothetical protein
LDTVLDFETVLDTVLDFETVLDTVLVAVAPPLEPLVTDFEAERLLLGWEPFEDDRDADPRRDPVFDCVTCGKWGAGPNPQRQPLLADTSRGRQITS